VLDDVEIGKFHEYGHTYVTPKRGNGSGGGKRA